jgi:hypothetical protein
MTTATVVEFSFNLNKRDMDILRTLDTIMKIENRKTFSADDIFLYGLDRFFPDKVHGIGGWFAKQQHHGNIRRCGTRRSVRPSNHLRRISAFERCEEQK